MKLIHAPSSTSQPLLPPSPSAFLSSRRFTTSPPTSPPAFSNGNSTEPCRSSSASSELSSSEQEERIYGWSCRVFKVWNQQELWIFSLWPNNVGHSLSSLPQNTTGPWHLLWCIMEQKKNPLPVTSPYTHFVLNKIHWWHVGVWWRSKLSQSEQLKCASWAT